MLTEEESAKLELTLVVDPDGEVVEPKSIDIARVQVIIGRVNPCDAADFKVLTSFDIKQAWSATGVSCLANEVDVLEKLIEYLRVAFLEKNSSMLKV